MQHITVRFAFVRQRFGFNSKTALTSELQAILPSTGEASSAIANQARLFPRRYGFLWFFGAPLAADRGRASDHRVDFAANLRGV